MLGAFTCTKPGQGSGREAREGGRKIQAHAQTTHPDLCLDLQPWLSCRAKRACWMKHQHTMSTPTPCACAFLRFPSTSSQCSRRALQ
jgi:hypothetical protein